MKKLHLYFVLFVHGFCFSQNDSLAVYTADTIIVMSTRTAQPILEVPYALTSIGQNSIQQGSELISLEEVLQSVPGLFVNNRNNFALGDRISIRGIGTRAQFGVRGIKIILDEIPLTMADGQSQLNNLDLASAGNISVIRGPSASLYGNAAGGIIEIQSRKVNQNQVQPRVVFGSYGLSAIQANATMAMGKAGYLINIGRFKTDGFRDHSASDNWSLNMVAENPVSDNLKLKSVFNYYYAPFSLNPSSLSKEIAKNKPRSTRSFIIEQGAGEHVWQGQAGATIFYTPQKNQTFKFTLFGLIRSLKNPIPSDIIELDRTAGGIRFSWNQTGNLWGHKYNILSGVDAELQKDERSESENNGLKDLNIERENILEDIEYGTLLQEQNENVTSLGPFAKLDFSPGKDWRVTLGARMDHYIFQVDDHLLTNGDDSGKREFNHLSPMLGIVYFSSPLNSVYMNYSTAFQTPTTSEFSNLPDGAGGINPDLSPETIYSYEVGAKGFLPGLNLSYQLAFYYMVYKDMLISFQNAVNERQFFRNAGKAKNTGFESFLIWQVTQNVSTTLSFTAMDFIYTNFVVDSLVIDGNKVPGVAPQKFHVSLNYSKRDVFGEIRFNWVDKYYVDDHNDFFNNAYTILDIKAGAVVDLMNYPATFYTGINNIFDARYNGSVVPNAFGNRYYEPSPGRNWYTGLQVKF